jgi:intracellular multiplication protein IcmL
MAEDELQIVRLKTDYYRDGVSRILVAIAMVITTVIVLIALLIYLMVSKPEPVYFSTDDEFRVLSPVPIAQPYLSDADLYQWVSQALPMAFTYDFLNYNSQQQEIMHYFTPAGWQNLQGHINNFHLDFNSLQRAKMFVNAELTGAPFIINKGLLEGKYAWYVQIPLNLSYSNSMSSRALVVVAKVVRISTVDNLEGVAIDNMSITTSQESQDNTNG